MKFSRIDLNQHICAVLNIKTLTPVIEKQIERFTKEHGLDYKTIARALSFYIEIEGKKYEPQFGISFVEYFHERANKYYDMLARRELEKIASTKNKKPDIILEVKEIKEHKSIPEIDITKLGDD